MIRVWTAHYSCFANDKKGCWMKRYLLVNKTVQSSAPAVKSNTVTTVATVIHSFHPSSKFLIGFLSLILTTSLFAQNITEQQQAEYKKVITERATKIVNTLSITDSDKYQKVVAEISNQYFQLNNIQEQSKIATDAIKAQALTKEATAEAVKKKEDEKALHLTQLHDTFIAHLKELLTNDQLELVKDGMTYRVLPITWAAYLDMLPTLTTEQKDKMYNWLKEARELAMDGESSDKKHAIFGKYKGRINNYLSAQGYDMNKEGEEWQKRIKEREAAKKEQKN